MSHHIISWSIARESAQVKQEGTCISMRFKNKHAVHVLFPLKKKELMLNNRQKDKVLAARDGLKTQCNSTS